MTKHIRIHSAEGAYPVYIGSGLLENAGAILKRTLGPAMPVALMRSQTAGRLYGGTVRRSLQSAGYAVQDFSLPTGEENKNLATVSRLYDELIAASFDRGCLIVNLGGGLAGDIGGFTAATLYRGIPFVQIPTTLLAQVDASVGGKTGVNHPEGKNLIGAFCRPEAVLIDPAVLRTLEMRERISGFAEVLKYGFIRDRQFLDYCLEHREDILELRVAEILQYVIRRSLEIKAAIVEADEKEKDARMLLNFGHTLGHALERTGAYRRFRHGEAVLAGMCAALRLSVLTGRIAAAGAGPYLEGLRAVPLEDTLENINTGALLSALRHDKKSRGRQLRFILLADIGRAEAVPDIPEHLIRESIEWTREFYSLRRER